MCRLSLVGCVVVVVSGRESACLKRHRAGIACRETERAQGIDRTTAAKATATVWISVKKQEEIKREREIERENNLSGGEKKTELVYVRGRGETLPKEKTRLLLDLFQNPNNGPFGFKKAKEGRRRRRRGRDGFFQTLRPAGKQARTCPWSVTLFALASRYRRWWLKIKNSTASRLPWCPTSSKHSLPMLSPQNNGK